MFNRRIKSYLKKDSLSTTFIFCIKLLNAPFSSHIRNNSLSHFFLFLLFFFLILNKTTSWKNKMSFPSESDMMWKELQNSDLIYVNLMTDAFKIIVKYRRKNIVKYCHLLPSENRALEALYLVKNIFCLYFSPIPKLWSFLKLLIFILQFIAQNHACRYY